MTNPNEYAETLERFRAMGLPLSMVRRYFPATVREEIRKVEKPGSCVLAAGRALTPPTAKEVIRLKSKARKPVVATAKAAKPKRQPVHAADVAADVLRSCATVCGIVQVRKEIKQRYPNMKD